MSHTPQELLICSLARELRDGETIAVGNNSPIPAAAALLARASHAPSASVYILGDEDNWPFESTEQFFSLIQRGGVDVFFLGGAQIDPYGSINLHTIGPYEKPKVRMTGGAGSAMVYYRSRRVLLFKTDHNRKGFPERADFVSSHASASFRAQGYGVLDSVHTPLAVLRPSPQTGRLRLSRTAPGVTAHEVQQQTGFELEIEEGLLEIEVPSEHELGILRSQVKTALKRIYPEFTAGGIGNG